MNKKNKARAFSLSLSFGEGWGGALILIIIFTISSCRKYPEGGSYFLTDMTKKIAGEYSFTHYYIDGKDSVNYYFNNDYVGNLSLVYGKTSENPLSLGFKYHNEEHNNLNFGISGYNWYCAKNNKSIYLYFGFPPNDTIFHTGPFKDHIKTKWDIRKLKDNYLFIETDFEGKHYRAELKKWKDYY